MLDLDSSLTDANDADSTLTIAVTTVGNVTVTVDSSTHVVRFKAGINYNGTDSVSFTATDPWGHTATDTVVVQITPVNDPPVITSADLVAATEDIYFHYTALATDVDGPTLTWTFDQRPTWLLADADSAYGTPLEGASAPTQEKMAMALNDGSCLRLRPQYPDHV